MMDTSKIEKTHNDLETMKTTVNDLLVAIRGGGDLGAAADAAQAKLDEVNAPVPEPADLDKPAAAEAPAEGDNPEDPPAE